MTTRTVARLTAAVVVSVVAFVLCGIAGLWGVAFAAPALLLAPSRGRAVVVREEPVTAEQAVAVWSRDHEPRG